MESQKIALIVGVTLALVVLFNLAIFAAVKRRKDTVGDFELFRRAMKKGRDPWKDENANLQELAKKVADLKKTQVNGNKTDDSQTNLPG